VLGKKVYNTIACVGGGGRDNNYLSFTIATAVKNIFIIHGLSFNCGTLAYQLLWY
jgi:hypothetical protein